MDEDGQNGRKMAKSDKSTANKLIKPATWKVENAHVWIEVFVRLNTRNALKHMFEMENFKCPMEMCQM